MLYLDGETLVVDSGRSYPTGIPDYITHSIPTSSLSKMYHSISFTYANEWMDQERKHGTVNTWDDWHLVPTSRPVFNPPPVKTVYIDIPGSNGKLDLSEALTGHPLYDNRTGSLEFIVMNGWRASWAGGFSKFANWLHGKELRAVLDDDPSYYYEGRFTFKEWKSNNDGTWSNVTFDYDLKPYKYSLITSTEDWLWDPFNFETDIIYNCNNLPVSGHAVFKIHNNAMPVVPAFIFKNPGHEGGSFGVLLNGVGVSGLDPGVFKDPRLELKEGLNELTVIGNGTVSINFRGGSL